MRAPEALWCRAPLEDMDVRGMTSIVPRLHSDCGILDEWEEWMILAVYELRAVGAVVGAQGAGLWRVVGP